MLSSFRLRITSTLPGLGRNPGPKGSHRVAPFFRSWEGDSASTELGNAANFLFEDDPTEIAQPEAMEMRLVRYRTVNHSQSGYFLSLTLMSGCKIQHDFVTNGRLR